eukprot:TRINITY_DN16959_c0_g1_i2.p1 TRINITY_DN16959_c0_g1~~TRINITY_DN16959_c0_g1_i2.p1  ORF type:complete len:127 (-),score=14.10 TRINITY_DN16959_c0_g1_i2:501-881(-)
MTSKCNIVVSELPLYDDSPSNKFVARARSRSYTTAGNVLTGFFLAWLAIEVDYNAASMLWETHIVFMIVDLFFIIGLFGWGLYLTYACSIILVCLTVNAELEYFNEVSAGMGSLFNIGDVVPVLMD